MSNKDKSFLLLFVLLGLGLSISSGSSYSEIAGFTKAIEDASLIAYITIENTDKDPNDNRENIEITKVLKNRTNKEPETILFIDHFGSKRIFGKEGEFLVFATFHNGAFSLVPPDTAVFRVDKGSVICGAWIFGEKFEKQLKETFDLYLEEGQKRGLVEGKIRIPKKTFENALSVSMECLDKIESSDSTVLVEAFLFSK